MDPGADEAAIKKAFRKLALKAHPDQAKSPGAASDFVRIMQAYDTLLGRHRGNTSEMAQPSKRESWEFHDWYWQFAANRRWSSKQRKQQAAASSSSPFHSAPATSATTQAQLVGLKRKAAFRQVKARHAQHAGSSKTSSPVHPPPAAPSAKHASDSSRASASPSYCVREETSSSHHQPVHMAAWTADSSAHVPMQHTQSTAEEDFMHECTQLGDELEASIRQSLDSLYINMQLVASVPAAQVIDLQQQPSSPRETYTGAQQQHGSSVHEAYAHAQLSYTHVHATTGQPSSQDFMQQLMSHRTPAVMLQSHLPVSSVQHQTPPEPQEQPAMHAMYESAKQHGPADHAESEGPNAGSLSGFSHVQSQLAGLKRRSHVHAQ